LKRRTLSVLVGIFVLASLVSTAPLRAADERNTLVVVQPGDDFPQDLLAEDEVERIRELAQPAVNFGILSDVSPDDRWIVLGTANGPTLMSVETGEQIGFPPIGDDLGIIPLQAVWRDARTLVLLSGLFEKRNAAMAVFSFDTGTWTIEELPFPTRSLVDVAPNGSRVLIAMREEALRLQVYDLQARSFQDVGQFDLDFQAFVRSSWSQDGSRLAYMLDRLPDRISSRIFRDGVLLNSYVARDVMGRLPPSENPILQRNEVRVYDFANQQQWVWAARNGDGAIARDVSWSTDGKTLMVQTDYPALIKGRKYPIYTIPSRGEFRFYDNTLKELNRFALPDPLVYGEFVSPDEVIYQNLRGMNLDMFYYNRVSKEVRKITSQAGSHGLITSIIATRQSRKLIFDHSSFTSPFDLYRINWDGSALSRLTWTTEELRQSANLRQDPVSFKTGKITFNGVLIQSADAPFPPKNKPIVIWQEGGPMNGVFNSWGARVEQPFALLPNFGFAVLVVPLQGRFGLGGANLAAMADNDNFGQFDIDTQADIARQLVTRGWAAKGKVGITGCSYGGYFALMSIVRHSKDYAAANPQCGLYDVITEWNRGYPDLMGLLQNGSSLERIDEFQRDSPLYNTARVKTPVLIFHGSEDFLPVTLAENFFQTVKDRGTPARMVKFIGAGHGIVPAVFDLTEEDIDNYTTYAAQEQISWFRQYMAP
jgi:dipeptidyl aminopeptidase/acylaminoacyl peptidase